MLNDKKIKFTVLDGDREYQRKSTEIFLSTLTKEQEEISKSDKLAYLDED